MDLNVNETTSSNNEDGVLTENTFLEKTWKDDFTFIIESRKLYTVKAVLAYVSPVFDRMFQSDFKEKNQDEMELPNKKFDDVLEFLHCVCPGKQTDICDQNVYRLLPLAEEYQVSYLKSRCEDFLIGRINEETSPDDLYHMLQLASTYNMDRLHAECVSETSKKSIEDLDRALKKISIPLKTICAIQDKMLRRLEKSERENKCLKAVNKYLLFQLKENERRTIQASEGWEGILLEFEMNIEDLERGRTLSKEFKIFDMEAKFNARKRRGHKALELGLSFDKNKICGWEISVFGRIAIKNGTGKNQDLTENFQMLCRNESANLPNYWNIGNLFDVEKGYIYHGKMDAEVYILADQQMYPSIELMTPEFDTLDLLA
ncbi:uncharacterized protein LOC123559973 [Mercenaria mercenaria]|uniref:uncharacterized protein LOC123559973 n=1 Tax=Mercenaria mercenaria TaxID=6596 RepID=UPI00234F6616|nr:uncharacterized protein LOC123559973 [Mercenaria mercenaria]